MTSTSLDNSTSEKQMPVYVLPGGADKRDNVSLLDLYRIIADHKKLILTVTLISLAIGLVYIFISQPVYRAETSFLPPHQQDIQELLVSALAEQAEAREIYTPDIIYNQFIQNFKSNGLRREFFDAHNLSEYYAPKLKLEGAAVDKLFEDRFNRKLIVEVDKRNSLLVQGDKLVPSFMAASLYHTDPELAAQWLNQFVTFINERTVNQLYTDIFTEIEARRKEIQKQLDSMLTIARLRRQDRVVELTEALRIARKLGVKDVSSLSVVADDKGQDVEVNMASMPLYSRGVNALEEEISVIKSRESDEPFIPGLRETQEQLALLENINVDIGRVSTVTVDSIAGVPYSAEKPKKALALILAMVFGLVAGVIAAFVASQLATLRREDQL